MRYNRMTKLLLGLLAIVILAVVFSSCGSGRSHCNTKGKTRVEMGFM
jgi:hypothetical protein